MRPGKGRRSITQRAGKLKLTQNSHGRKVDAMMRRNGKSRMQLQQEWKGLFSYARQAVMDFEHRALGSQRNYLFRLESAYGRSEWETNACRISTLKGLGLPAARPELAVIRQLESFDAACFVIRKDLVPAATPEVVIASGCRVPRRGDMGMVP